MKQFIKYTFAAILGSLITFFLIFFIFFIAFAASAPQVTIEQNSLLHLKLNYALPELTDNVPSNTFSPAPSSVIGLHDIIAQIDRAAADEKISGILLQTESSFMNPTTAMYISEALSRFKGSQKPIWAYGHYFTQSGYIIASTADSVFMNPNGLIDLRGYGTANPYFEEFSEKTGIDFEVYHAGKYKSAVEPYYRNSSSPENRYQSKIFLQQFHDQLVNQISEQRNLSTEKINETVVYAKSTNGQECKDQGLVDALIYEHEFQNWAKEMLGSDELHLVRPTDYQTVLNRQKKKEADPIAVIIAEGNVAGFDGEKGSITTTAYNKVFDDLEKNNEVKAVVLRVNSPGGSVWTADNFLDRIRQLQENGKTVVASFGDYAASGGYYIGASADHIVSQATTLTGSIGAFSMLPNFYKGSKEHLGINWDTISTGKRTFMYSSFIPKSAADRGLLQAQTDQVYHQFKDVVASGRNWTIDEVEEIAQGRVWTGTDAYDIGLVDTLGSLSDAIEIAAKMTETTDYRIEYYPKIEKTFWESMISALGSNIGITPPNQSSILSDHLRELQEIFGTLHQACKEPQMRLPIQILTN